jgi:hypothetical protein
VVAYCLRTRRFRESKPSESLWNIRRNSSTVMSVTRPHGYRRTATLNCQKLLVPRVFYCSKWEELARLNSCPTSTWMYKVQTHSTTQHSKLSAQSLHVLRKNARSCTAAYRPMMPPALL